MPESVHHVETTASPPSADSLIGLKLATQHASMMYFSAYIYCRIERKRENHVFRTRLSPRFDRAPRTCPCAVKVVATPPWTLARGFRGLRAPGRPLLGPPPTLLEVEVVDGAEDSPIPVVRRRAAGRSGGAEVGRVELMSGALPSTARRARSCRVCTVRKWARSSGHLISSRASFDLVATVTTVLLQ